MKLGSLAKLIRSKNAGPTLLSIDILFENQDNFLKVEKAKVLSKENISSLYNINIDLISIYESFDALAIKITFPRKIISGNHDDNDVFGGQQHGPLVDLNILRLSK